jgi:diacylglycerol kinase family enzyme
MQPLSISSHARRVLVLANPRSGTGKSRRLVDGLIVALRQRGLEASVYWDREEFSAALRSLDPREVRCVVAAGGDGTLLEVVNRAPHLPAALLPLGNENLVAEYYRFERCGRRLAARIAAGQVQHFDLARANGRLFCLMASAGFDADVVHRLHRRRRGHINRFSYVVPVLQTVQSYPHSLIDVEVLDTGERLRGSMVYVFNLPLYGLRVPIAPEARPDDGWLDLCVFERPGLVSLARYLAALVAQGRDRLADVQHRRVRRVQLTAAEPVPVQADGDPAGALPLTIEILPGALALLTPPHGGTA